MGKFAGYLRRCLGIDRLGRELGSLKAMQVTYRERDGRHFTRLQAGIADLAARNAELAAAQKATAKAIRTLDRATRADLVELMSAQKATPDALKRLEDELATTVARHLELNEQQLDVAEDIGAKIGSQGEQTARHLDAFADAMNKHFADRIERDLQAADATAGFLREIGNLRAELVIGLQEQMERRLHTFEQTITEHLSARHKQYFDTTRDIAGEIAQLRAETVTGVLDHTRSQLDGFDAAMKAHLAQRAKLDQKHLDWTTATARMIGDMRAEVRLLLQAPAADGGQGNQARDPKVLREYTERSNIRELYPTELFDIEQVKLPLSAINEESGHENKADLMYVVAIAKAVGARRMFEFGTYQGRTTYHLASLSARARVITLNLPPDKDPKIAPYLGTMFRGSPYEKRITQIFEDSTAFDPSPFAGTMDFVFVDADHSYDGVKNDSEKALSMLRPGGVIAWHDYAAKSPGVVRFIHEFAKDRPVFRLKGTCVIVYIDGVDAMNFTPMPRRPSVLSGREKARAAAADR